MENQPSPPGERKRYAVWCVLCGWGIAMFFSLRASRRLRFYFSFLSVVIRLIRVIRVLLFRLITASLLCFLCSFVASLSYALFALSA